VAPTVEAILGNTPMKQRRSWNF